MGKVRSSNVVVGVLSNLNIIEVSVLSLVGIPGEWMLMVGKCPLLKGRVCFGYWLFCWHVLHLHMAYLDRTEFLVRAPVTLLLYAKFGSCGFFRLLKC